MEKKLPRIWEVNEPYPDVISGALTEDIFAASLGAVKNGNAASIYQDPNEFFEKTHVTDALKDLIQLISQKLNNTHPEFNSVYKLETSFGGGKTHCLIALYHAFSKGEIESETFKEIIGEIELPKDVKIVCIDGSDYDAINGIEIENGLFVKTLWGDLAYQLNGKEGYNRIKKNDEKQVSPGAKQIETLIGDSPAIILIDEIANYFNKASGVVVGSSTLAKQTNTFLFDLLAALVNKPKVVVVLTLASSKDAFSEYTAEVNNVLNEAGSVVARKARILYPTKENEMYGVIRRRLFKKWDETAAKTIADAYFSMYESTDELNNKFKTKEYKDYLIMSYPFHRELIDILETRVSSYANFQRTRGALRLLARVISDIWNKKEEDVHIILPAYVALDNQRIKDELTGKIKKDDLIPVIHADIANTKGDAKAQLWNKDYLDKKMPPLASRMANTTYLYSLIIGEAKGMDQYTILGSIMTPGINPSVYFNLLNKMDQKFWYFRESNSRYYFHSEPTINKIIQDYMSIVDASKIRARIRATLENEFSGPLFTRYIQPNGPSDVRDDDKLKLMVLDYKYTSVDSKGDKTPHIINQIWNKARDEAPRIYKNTTFFIVADSNQISRLEDITREYEAYQKMDENREDLANLTKDQREKLEAKKKDIELSLKIAVANTYRFLYYPRNQMEVAELDPALIGESSKKRQKVIYELLKAEGKIQDSIKSNYAKSRAWPTHKKRESAKTFKDWFYQKFNLPIPTKLEVIKNTIRDGVKEKLWVYHKGNKVFVHDESISQVALTENEELILLQEAIKLGLVNEDGEKCATCKKWPCECEEKICSKCKSSPCKCEEKICPKCKSSPCKCEEIKKKILFKFNTGKGSADLMVKKLKEKIQHDKPDYISQLEITANTLTGGQSFITLFVHLPEFESLYLDLDINKSQETPSSVKKIKVDFSSEKEDYRDFFNSLKSFVESKKLSLEITLTLNFKEETSFSVINKFLTNLQNYTVEFNIKVAGKIIRK